jgi:putative ABC transport system substrate-binding protein
MSGMRRREFITLLGGAAATWPLAARAQQPAMPVIGFPRSTSSADSAHLVAAFHQGLREAGFVEGQDCALEYRWAIILVDCRRWSPICCAGRWPCSSAIPLRRSRPMPQPRRCRSSLRAGATPVKLGLVASLNRPGGNVTGISFITADLGAKQLGLLRELRPAAALIAVLVDPKAPLTERFVSGLTLA